MRVEISNWHDVVAQFGLTDRSDGVLSAKELSKELTKKASFAADQNIFIPCNKNSEADACFSLDSNNGSTLYYSYLGTAN